MSVRPSMLRSARGHADLAEESLGAEDGPELGTQELERDAALVADVAGEVNGRHAAATDLAIDVVAAGQRGGERGAIIHELCVLPGCCVRVVQSASA